MARDAIFTMLDIDVKIDRAMLNEHNNLMRDRARLKVRMGGSQHVFFSVYHAVLWSLVAVMVRKHSCILSLSCF